MKSKKKVGNLFNGRVIKSNDFSQSNQFIQCLRRKLQQTAAAALVGTIARAYFLFAPFQTKLEHSSIKRIFLLFVLSSLMVKNLNRSIIIFLLFFFVTIRVVCSNSMHSLSVMNYIFYFAVKRKNIWPIKEDFWH